MAKKPTKKPVKNPALSQILRGLSRERGQIKPISLNTGVRVAHRPKPAAIARSKPKPKPSPKPAKPVVVSAPASVKMLKTINTMRMPKVALAPKVLKANVKLHNAALASAISSIAVANVKFTPRKKSDIDAPVSSAPEPTGTTIFENGKDANRKYVLPEYRVAEDVNTGPSGTIRRESVSSLAGPDGLLVLKVGLEPHRQVPHTRNAADAEFIDHSIRCVIRYPVQANSSSLQDVAAEEILEGSDGRLVARFRFASTGLASAALSAILDSGTAKLVVNRVAQVWLPVAKKAPAPKKPKPNDRSRRARPRTRARRARPATADARLTLGRPRTNSIHLRHMERAIAAAAAAQQYRRTSRTFSQELPFSLLRDLHGDLTDALSGDLSDGGGFQVRRVGFEGRMHSYLIDPTDRHRIYFLPDAFRLQRKNDVPRTPLMLVRSVPSPDEGGDEQFELEFIATPHIDEDRLLAASNELGFTDTAGEHHAFEFAPLAVSGAELRLALPGSSGGGFEIIANAQVDLQSGISVRLQLAEGDFLSIFSSLRGVGSHIVMNGEVKLDMGGPAPETIPVELRLNQMNGEVFEIDRLERHSPRVVNISLLNVIESPAKVNGLRPVAIVGENTIPLSIVEKQPNFGELIEPGTDFRFRAQANSDLPADGSFHVLFEDMDVVVETDHEAVFDAVYDESSSVALQQDITVRTFAQFFTASTDHPQGALIAFHVELEDGPDVALEANAPEVETSLELPLSDIVFRRESEGEFRYRVSEVRERGFVGPTVWKSKTGEMLIIGPIQESDLA